MRRLTAAAIGGVLLCGIAEAQTAAPPAQAGPEPTRGYIEAVAQSAFGNVTSQSYGVEIGVAVRDNVQIFAEGGQVRNVATPAISTGAQAIAAALTQVQPAAVSFSVRQPVTFFGGGLRYVVSTGSARAFPYVLAGFGAARVKNDVAFQLGGADASATLSQYVTLGGDLSGSFTKGMLMLGGGVAVPVLRQLVVDFQYRYGRILADGGGINVNRAGLGVGVRF